MIKYGDLVQYIKRNHISWNRDLFDVLRGFFEEYSQQPHPLSPPPPIQQEHKNEYSELEFEVKIDFKPPEDGEYTNNDLMNLFST